MPFANDAERLDFHDSSSPHEIKFHKSPILKKKNLLIGTLPDALSSGCSKCNQKQKDVAEKVINHLKANRSRDWERLLAKYDPKGEYKKRFEGTRSA